MSLDSEQQVERVGNQRPRLSALPKATAPALDPDPDRYLFEYFESQFASAGPDAIEFAEGLGYKLDDWQKWVVCGMLSEDRHVRLCSTVICLIVSRQNGKNVILEVVELYAFYILEWNLILHTAHLQSTSANHMACLQAVVEANPMLDDITVFSTANGKERMTRIDTGAVMYFITRGKKAGRGPSPKMVVFDEALYVTDDQIKALIPSMSAQSMNDDMPLMVYTSSAPLEDSVVLHRIRNKFIAGALDGFFAEWSVVSTEEEPIDINDRDLWFEANPGMGIRIDPDWVETNELSILSRIDFMGERLGVAIGGGDDSSSGVFGAEHWKACEDPGSEIEDGAPSYLALSVGPGMVWSSFSESGQREDGDLHMEVVRREPGTAWVVDAAVKLTKRLGCDLTVDPKSPTGGLIDKLVKAGVPIYEISLEETMLSCSGLQIDVLNHRIHHINQAPLNAAVVGAAVRPVGESWVWSQKSSDVDITALTSCTLAAGRARLADPETEGDLWFAMS